MIIAHHRRFDIFTILHENGTGLFGISFDCFRIEFPRNIPARETFST